MFAYSLRPVNQERVQCPSIRSSGLRSMKFSQIAGFVLLFCSVAVAQKSRTPIDLGPDSGSVHGDEYKNDFFGFAYAFPRDWSVLNRQSQTGIRLSKGRLYTLLFVSTSPTGTMGPADAGIVVLAEDVSPSGIRDGKDGANKLVELLSHTEPPHTMLLAPQEVILGGNQFYRLEYEQQTFPTARHYFCTVVGVLSGYVLRFSIIADTKARMNEACATTASLRFKNK